MLLSLIFCYQIHVSEYDTTYIHSCVHMYVFTSKTHSHLHIRTNVGIWIYKCVCLFMRMYEVLKQDIRLEHFSAQDLFIFIYVHIRMCLYCVF